MTDEVLRQQQQQHRWEEDNTGATGTTRSGWLITGR